MAELSADDVEAFTGGRMSADDDETERILATALVRARRYCGWHVSPVAADAVFTLDGPGGVELFVPTRKIVSLTSITNDGVAVSLSDVAVPAQAPWKIVRSSGWWSTEYSGVVVTADHGYTEAEAADWRQAVLEMCSEMGSSSGRSDSDLIVKQVDDVMYRWGPAAETALMTVRGMLDDFELRPVFHA